ncbi:hypothetical protein BD779DRAFT_1680909 [Infundibulicybe gibba]|nr:hypothetical protein BD779DRAFT_1680909 [Infundibulicybe gibba]
MASRKTMYNSAYRSGHGAGPGVRDSDFYPPRRPGIQNGCDTKRTPFESSLKYGASFHTPNPEKTASPTPAHTPRTPSRNHIPNSRRATRSSLRASSTLNLDRIAVPAGWGGWAVLRGGPEARTRGEAWERNLEGNAKDPPSAARIMREGPRSGQRGHG